MAEGLLSRFKGFIKRVFDIRAGEFRRVRLMFLNVFLLVQCIWIIKPVVNTQFLSRVGIEKLPLVFLLVALTALVVSPAYSRLLNRMALDKIMFRTYMISIFFLLSYTILIYFDLFGRWVIYLSYIGVALFSLITTSQFWLLGNLVFGSLEAKRLFGFIGAGAIAGGISGGYVTSVLAPLMDSNNLLFLATTTLIISMGVNHWIWLTCVPTNNDAINKPKTLNESPLRLIRNSKLLSYLALIMGISVVVAKLVEFQFSAIASARLTDPNQLTAFFGFWFSTSNVISLVIQVFFTQRVMRFIGVGQSLFILPGALFAGAAAVLNTPVLWAATTLKLFDISLKQSINKAATELMILPVPLTIKGQVKTFLDVFVDTTATGIGGIMLIFLVNGFNFSVRSVCIMILILICLWMYLVFRVRREYVQAFQEKLGVRQSPKRKDLLQLDPSEVEQLRHTLQFGSIKRILLLLERIKKSKDPMWMQWTVPLLKHGFPKVRQAVLKCLYYYTEPSLASQIEPLLKDPDDEVRFRAFSCLVMQSQDNRIRFIRAHLNHKDPAINGAALAALATEARDNPVMQYQFNLEQRLLKKTKEIELLVDPEEIKTTKITVALAIGYGKLESFYLLLRDFIMDNNPAVVRHAIHAAGYSQNSGFIKILLGFLPNKSMRSFAHKALAQYDPLEVLPYLIEMSNDKGVLDEILIQLAALAETMDTQHAVDFLFELVQTQNPVVQLKAIHILHKMKVKFPHLTVGGKRVMPILMEDADLYRDTLALNYAAQQRLPDHDHDEDPKISKARKELIQLMERNLDSILHRIFWLLGLTYPPGITLPVFKDPRNLDPAIRINTVELLDNILEPSLKKVVIPILEIAMLETLPDDVLIRLQLVVPTELSCFESLLKGKDQQLKLAVLALIEAMENPDYAHLVHMAAADDQVSVKKIR